MRLAVEVLEKLSKEARSCARELNLQNPDAAARAGRLELEARSLDRMVSWISRWALALPPEREKGDV